jgi:hypothetical protein
MEARLGADFDDVRLHTDPAAQRSAAAIGARAYTSGGHVVIGAGGTDKHTLAHELAHVIQQRSGPVAGTECGQGLRISDPSDRFEREAEVNAKRAMSGSTACVPRATTSAVGRTSTAPAASSPIQRTSHVDQLAQAALENYDQRQAEFQGNQNVQVEARVNPERLVHLLTNHAEDRGKRGRTVKDLLREMARGWWCITAGPHEGGVGGAARAADPNRHITLNVRGRGYHVQLMANDEFQNVTGG